MNFLSKTSTVAVIGIILVAMVGITIYCVTKKDSPSVEGEENKTVVEKFLGR